jgi:hypothetical protein
MPPCPALGAAALGAAALAAAAFPAAPCASSLFALHPVKLKSPAHNNRTIFPLKFHVRRARTAK